MGSISSHLPVVTPRSYEEVDEDVDSPSPADVTPPRIVFTQDEGKTTTNTLKEEEEARLKHLTALIDPRSPTIGVSRTPVEASHTM
jgi:hypothetical protein